MVAIALSQRNLKEMSKFSQDSLPPQTLCFCHKTGAGCKRTPFRLRTAMKQGSAGQAPLSPHRAFVVQFRVETEVEQGRFVGRVEHVVSGQATRFHSLEELLAFIQRVLTAVRTAPPEEP